MRNLIILLIGLMTLSVWAFAESYRKTTSDMYMATMGQTGVAGIRADAYRSMYEICDRHHNCTNVTAGISEQPVEAGKQHEQKEPVIPFVHMPVWL